MQAPAVLAMDGGILGYVAHWFSESWPTERRTVSPDQLIAINQSLIAENIAFQAEKDQLQEQLASLTNNLGQLTSQAEVSQQQNKQLTQEIQAVKWQLKFLTQKKNQVEQALDAQCALQQQIMQANAALNQRLQDKDAEHQKATDLLHAKQQEEISKLRSKLTSEHRARIAQLTADLKVAHTKEKNVLAVKHLQETEEVARSAYLSASERDFGNLQTINQQEIYINFIFKKALKHKNKQLFCWKMATGGAVVFSPIIVDYCKKLWKKHNMDNKPAVIKAKFKANKWRAWLTKNILNLIADNRFVQKTFAGTIPVISVENKMQQPAAC